MGAEAQATVKFGSASSEGKALLETDELLFRGDFRLKIAFKDITSLHAVDGRLSVTYPDGTAVFTLGSKAEQWADKIRNPKRLIDKLGVKADHRVVVLNVDDAEFADQLNGRAEDVSTRLRKDADVIFFGVASVGELARLTKLRDSMQRDGMMWVIAPKGKGGIKDTDVLAAGRAAGLVDVKIAGFSASHSATKFVIPKSQR